MCIVSSIAAVRYIVVSPCCLKEKKRQEKKRKEKKRKEKKRKEKKRKAYAFQLS